jgi:hypothetical protein
VTEAIIETLGTVDLLLPFFITHEATSDTHISLVIPNPTIILFRLTLLFILLEQRVSSR